MGKHGRERTQGDGDPPVNAGITGLLEHLPEGSAAECLAAPWLPLLRRPPALPPSLPTTNSGWWLAPLPVSFTYVNDNPQEVIVGERRELASLDLLNHFITGTSFEWPSSAGWPAPHLLVTKRLKSLPVWRQLDIFPNFGKLGMKESDPTFSCLPSKGCHIGKDGGEGSPSELLW